MNDPDLFVLAQECASLSRQISELMLGPISDEAKRFIAQGFVIPAPEALAHAANVFGEVAKMPGSHRAWSDDSNEERLDLICAFASDLQGLKREFDLDWSEQWRLFEEGKASDTLHNARLILGSWNAGKRMQLLEHMAANVVRHRAREGWER